MSTHDPRLTAEGQTAMGGAPTLVYTFCSFLTQKKVRQPYFPALLHSIIHSYLYNTPYNIFNWARFALYMTFQHRPIQYYIEQYYIKINARDPIESRFRRLLMLVSRFVVLTMIDFAETAYLICRKTMAREAEIAVHRGAISFVSEANT